MESIVRILDIAMCAVMICCGVAGVTVVLICAKEWQRKDSGECDKSGIKKSFLRGSSLLAMALAAFLVKMVV